MASPQRAPLSLRDPRRARHHKLHTLVALGMLASGCSILGLGDTERPGVIEFYGEAAEIFVPDTVSAGVGFEVVFYTFGGGCVSRGDTDVQVTENIAVLTPTDVHSDADVCTAELRYLDHTTTVRLDVPGAGAVIVTGRTEPGDAAIQRVFSVVVR